MTPWLRGAPVVWRVLTPALAARMAPAWIAVVLGYGVFEQVIRPREVMAALRVQQPGEAARTWGVVALAWALWMAPHLRAVCFGEGARPLWRLAVGRRLWAWWLAPGLAVCASLGLALPVWYLDALVLPRVVVMGLALGVAGLGLGHGSAAGLGAAASAVAGVSASAWLGAAWGWAWWPLGALATLAAPDVLGGLYRALHGRPLGWRGGESWLRPRGPISALVVREVWVLSRQERGVLGGWLVAAAITSGLAFAMARHGGPAEALVWSLTAAFGPLTSVTLTRAQLRLGVAWSPGRSPVSEAARGLASWLVAGGPLVALATLASAASGRLLDARGLVALLLAVALGWAWCWGVLARPRRPNSALYIMFATLAMLPMAWLPSALAAPALGLTAALWATLATRQLRRTRQEAA